MKDHPSDAGLFGFFIDVIQPVDAPFPSGAKHAVGESAPEQLVDHQAPLLVMPFPSRIDRVINGRFTTFPRIDSPPSVTLEGRKYTFDMDRVHEFLKESYLKLTRQHVTGHLKKVFNALNGEEWWYYTSRCIPRIPTLQDDVKTMMNWYLEDVYRSYILQSDLIAGARAYIDHVLDLCKRRMESNKITIRYNQHDVECRLHYGIKENRGQLIIQPASCMIDVEWLPVDDAIGWPYHKTDGILPPKPDLERKECIPYMVYRDLQECFEHNKKVIDSVGTLLLPPVLLEQAGIIVSGRQ
ncbi:MAG: hypothetical protein GYA24_04360 [Candidatus Lokiarchaeota archaeon]|nr:hypothetical protein [Candidatus Lokiarchaeota archaeon]